MKDDCNTTATKHLRRMRKITGTQKKRKEDSKRAERDLEPDAELNEAAR